MKEHLTLFNSTFFNLLTREIFCEIIKFLSFRDYCTLSQTNKKMLALTQDPLPASFYARTHGLFLLFPQEKNKLSLIKIIKGQYYFLEAQQIIEKVQPQIVLQQQFLDGFFHLNDPNNHHAPDELEQTQSNVLRELVYLEICITNEKNRYRSLLQQAITCGNPFAYLTNAKIELFEATQTDLKRSRTKLISIESNLKKMRKHYGDIINLLLIEIYYAYANMLFSMMQTMHHYTEKMRISSDFYKNKPEKNNEYFPPLLRAIPHDLQAISQIFLPMIKMALKAAEEIIQKDWKTAACNQVLALAFSRAYYGNKPIMNHVDNALQYLQEENQIATITAYLDDDNLYTALAHPCSPAKL
jgi:hypothetical protein